MAIDTAQEPRAPRSRFFGALDLRPQTLLLCILLPLVLTAGILGGLRLEALHAQKQEELQSLQNEKNALDNAQGNRIRDTQEADRLRFELEDRIERLQEQLKNRDGFLR